MGGIRENIPSSPLRRPVKINIYRRNRVIIDTLNDNEPNPAEQDRGEIKDKGEDKTEIESKNKNQTFLKRSDIFPGQRTGRGAK